MPHRWTILGGLLIFIVSFSSVSMAQNRMYWTDPATGKIQRSNLDGSGVEDLIPPGPDTPFGLALDLADGKMYWTGNGTDKIQRSNLDGSDVEDLVTTGLQDPTGLALDVFGGKMYWVDTGTDLIQRSNLDGSDVDTLVTTGLQDPTGLALDVFGGKMYWVDTGTDLIQRSNLDGSDVEDLVTTGLNGPREIALDVSREKMYWTNTGDAKIQRSNLDGSGVEDLVTSGLNGPFGITLDIFGGKIYWTDTGSSKIQRSNLDGSGVEDLITSGLTGPQVIALDASPTGPPLITSIIDVQNDQGRQARISWQRAAHDIAEAGPATVTNYTLWRRIDPGLPSIVTKASGRTAVPPGDWDFLQSVPAVQASKYSTVVSTLADSTADSGIYHSVFFVRAHSENPSIHFESVADSGYSVDNLVPSTPTNVAPTVVSNAVQLDWDQPADGDFRFFGVYRSTTSGFTPASLADTLGTTTDATFIDTDVVNGTQYFYLVSAIDFSGNESERSEEIMVAFSTTGIEENGTNVPEAFTLAQNRPNPFNPETTIAYSIPNTSHVRLVIYNVLGQPIRTLVDENQTVGFYSIRWDGRNDQAGRVASGFYLYRLEAGDFIEARKMLLLK